MPSLARLTSAKPYLSALLLLLGASLHFSMALSNVIFYLLFFSTLAYTCWHNSLYKKAHFKAVFNSPIFWLLALWLIALYGSVSYSHAKHHLLTDYAIKYLKYLAVLFFSYTTLSFFKRNIDLPTTFFTGFTIGGILVFLLGIFNKTTGLLKLAADDDLLPHKYLVHGYWLSNDYFTQSLFFAIIYAYGLMIFLKTKNPWALLICAIGLFEVFIVARERTGFILCVVTSLWLIWMLVPSMKKRAIATTMVMLVVILALRSDNHISSRVYTMVNNITTCYLHVSTNDGTLIDRVNPQNNGELIKHCYSSSGIRLLFYYQALQQISRSWLYGSGLADIRIDNVGLTNNGIAIQPIENPHNEYLLQIIQLGMLGLAFILALFMVSYLQALSLPGNRRYIYAGIIVMYATACLFNSFLLDSFQALFFTVIISFIIAEKTRQNLSPQLLSR